MLVKIEPEHLEVANTYLECMDLRTTASILQVPLDVIESIVNKREVQKYINSVFMEHGYNNRYKLHDALDNIIDKKLEELEETELTSSKDIADLLYMKHKMKMEELALMIKADGPKLPVVQHNTQNNYGSNYQDLMKALETAK